jgi:DNA mismatch repair ATPase MutS
VLPFSFLVLPLLYLVRRIDGPILLQSLMMVCVVQTGYAATCFRQTRSISDGVGPISIELPIVSEIFQIIEHEHFSSARLVALAGRVKQASPHMRRLKWLIRLLKQRDDAYFTAESYLLLWGTQFTMAIDRWRQRYGTPMLDWLAALGEFEALISLSAYAYEHPQDPFPEMLASGPALDAEGMAHPFLDENIVVRNDVQLGRKTQFLIVSGSNMSGKSTFIRAIGLNAVLAWMGAPVRCTKLRISPATIGAAIRIQDSLVDGQSHFLAEMKRLRRMIDVSESEPLLYLADEIMGGTNSHDRRIATEWVIRALVQRHAIGVITTHDLALTEIASTGLAGGNVYFEDSGEEGNLHFDYKLHCGLLTHSNALNIAHMLGIDTAAAGM